MPMRFRPIYVDNTLQELNRHGTADFPLSMDRQIVSAEGCLGVRHWHYEIQILVMIKGGAVFETPAGRYELKEGEGLFINSGVLHEALSCTGEDSSYICCDFAPEMISADRSDAVFRDYVEPVIASLDLQSFALRAQEAPWQAEVLRLLLEMGASDDAREYAYELSLKTKLLEIWRLIVTNCRVQAEGATGVSFADRLRVRRLKQFINEHYMEKLSLEDIASSAGLSRSECCRLFKRAGSLTPIAYLKEYRVAQSMKMLSCTGLSVAEIAYQCGFDSSSYFISCFKRMAGCTPLEYRTGQVTGKGRQDS